MKITVWGGSGFLGSYICDALSDIGHEIIIADIHESVWKRDDQQMLIGNIMDQDTVAESVENADYVFNFAGIADIDDANVEPQNSAEINILGNLNLLTACKNAKVKRYIFASSLYVYSNSGGFYRCSKQACEGYIDEYHRQYGLQFTVLRFSSLYGLRADSKNTICRFIRDALTKKKISYHGSPDALREYIHGEDAARICCEILDDRFSNQHLTITGHQTMRVGNLINMIGEILGEKIDHEFNTQARSFHYEITPYTFNPKLGLKYSPEFQIDMGAGLLEIMDAMHKEINENKKHTLP